jgi:hypothetical protein
MNIRGMMSQWRMIYLNGHGVAIARVKDETTDDNAIMLL